LSTTRLFHFAILHLETAGWHRVASWDQLAQWRIQPGAGGMPPVGGSEIFFAGILILLLSRLHTTSPRSEAKASGWLQSVVRTSDVLCAVSHIVLLIGRRWQQRTSYVLSSSVISRTFSVLCVYSTFEYHPHP